MKRSVIRGPASGLNFVPDFAEPVIGRRFAPTRWLHPGYDVATEEAESKRRAQGPPFYKNHFRQCWVPGRSGAPPGLEGYFLDFFFDFDFFAFFAFFAFLAIVSSQGLMDGNATRGMLGGGPASQHPRR